MGVRYRSGVAETCRRDMILSLEEIIWRAWRPALFAGPEEASLVATRRDRRCECLRLERRKGWRRVVPALP
jgi:hypothetical protein